MNIDKEDLKKFYVKYRILIFPALVGLSSLILIITVIFPQVRVLISNYQTLNQIKAQEDSLNVKAAQLSNIDQNKLSQNLSLSLSALPADPSLADAVARIQEVVFSSGFNLISVNISYGNTKMVPPGFTIIAAIEGPGAILGNLLVNIESSPRVMKVSSVELNRIRNSDAVSVALSVDAYYQEIPQSLGKIDDPLPTLLQEETEILNNLAQNQFSLASQATSVDLSLVQKGKANPFE